MDFVGKSIRSRTNELLESLWIRSFAAPSLWKKTAENKPEWSLRKRLLQSPRGFPGKYIRINRIHLCLFYFLAAGKIENWITKRSNSGSSSGSILQKFLCYCLQWHFFLSTGPPVCKTFNDCIYENSKSSRFEIDFIDSVPYWSFSVHHLRSNISFIFSRFLRPGLGRFNNIESIKWLLGDCW